MHNVKCLEEVLQNLNLMKTNASKKLKMIFDHNILNSLIEYLLNAYPEFSFSKFKLDENAIKSKLLISDLIKFQPNQSHIVLPLKKNSKEKESSGNIKLPEDDKAFYNNIFKFEIFKSILNDLEQSQYDNKDKDSMYIEIGIIKLIFDIVTKSQTLKKQILKFARLFAEKYEKFNPKSIEELCDQQIIDAKSFAFIYDTLTKFQKDNIIPILIKQRRHYRKNLKTREELLPFFVKFFKLFNHLINIRSTVSKKSLLLLLKIR